MEITPLEEHVGIANCSLCFMSCVRHYRLDLQLVANFLQCVFILLKVPIIKMYLSSQSLDFKKFWPAEKHFWAHKWHSVGGSQSIAMTEAQCEFQHKDRVSSPCLPGFPTSRTSIGELPVSNFDRDN